jgi:uncharacterized protein involved in cysteine biosynthesis
MFDLFVKSFAQLYDPRTRGVVWRCLGLALILYVGVVGLAWWGLSLLAFAGSDTLNGLIAAAGGVVAMILGSLVYPSVVTVLMGLFTEPICRRVETLYYPERGPGREQPFSEMLIGTINFAGKTLLLTLLTLLLTFFLPGVNIFVFIALNGYLVSVEYFEMVAVRRMGLKEAKILRKRHFARLWGAGTVFAVGMMIPLIGFVMPVVAMIFMVHMLETVRFSPANISADSRV